MEAGPQPSHVLRFGPFEADLEVGQLRKNGVRVKLPQQPFQVLVCLLERSGRVVTREALIAELWPNGTVVEYEHSLGTAINKIRQALDDSADNPQFVETLPRRGYRFLVPVERIGRPPEERPPQVAALAPQPGATISHYKITEKLSEGGMGVVYKAEDTKLDRPVALKFLAAHAIEDPEQKTRFLREAKAAARLDHQNICPVYEIDEVGGQTFITMAYLEGQTVKDKIGNRPLKLEEALDIAVQTAEGLQAAHEKGIVHRDIKANNLMVTPQGQVKVMDFGLAQLADGSKLTKTQTMLGTPAYMSPEQARREPTDQRTDVWSLGVVIYEMVTGRLPFEGERQEAVLLAIGNEEPEPITALRAGLPMELEWIVEKCLAKNAEQRYQHADEVLVDLMNLRQKLAAGKSTIPRSAATPPTASVRHTTPSTLPGLPAVSARAQETLVGPPQASPETPALQQTVRRQRLALAVLAVALLAALTIFAASLFQTGQPPRPMPVRFAITPDNLAPAETGRNVAVSPDGRFVAYLTGGFGDYTLWIHDLTQDTAREIPISVGFPQPFWSPDSRFLAFQSGGELKKVSAQGGAATTLCETAGALRGGSWSPDGNTIVFAYGGFRFKSLYRVPALGGDPEPLFEPGESRGDSLVFPHFLPSNSHGSLLLYIARTSDMGNRIVLGNLDTGEETDLAAGFAPVYSPSGHVLYSEGWDSDSVWALPFSIDTLRPTGEPFAVIAGGGHPSVTASGTLVYFEAGKGGLRRLIWRDRAGKKVGEIGQPQKDIFLPSLSPDGRFVGVEGVEERTGKDVWLHEVDRPIKTRFTFNGARDSRCIWSPDGKEIAFFSDRNGKHEVFIKPFDGSAEAQAVNRGYPDAWSPDGNYLIQSGSNIRYLKRDAEGGFEPLTFLQTEFNETAPQFSPDGRFVAYCSNESGRFEVYVRPFPEGAGQWQISQDGGSQPRWGRDGDEIFYVQGDTLFSVRVSSRPGFSVGAATKLFSDPGLQWQWYHPTYDVSGDGQRFVTIETIVEASKPRIRIVQNWFEELRNRGQD